MQHGGQTSATSRDLTMLEDVASVWPGLKAYCFFDVVVAVTVIVAKGPSYLLYWV